MKTNILFKTIALGILFVFFSGKTYAQQGIYFSLNTSPQNSWLFNSDDFDNDDFDYKATISAAFGLGAGYNFTDNIGIGMNILYSFQGQKNEINSTETITSLEYLKIPVFFSYTYNINENLGLEAKIGPHLSFLSNARLLDEDRDEIDDDITDVYNDVTFGAVVGIGTQYLISDNVGLFGNIRYDIDFTNAEDEDFSGFINSRETTLNSTLGLQVGIRYFLGQ